MRTRKEKEKILKELREKFQSTNAYFIVNLFNLKSDLEKKLRDTLKENGAVFQVVKKKLVYKANPQFPFVDEELKFSFGIIWDPDQNLNGIRAVKKLKDKDINFQIIKGYFNGQILNEKEIQTLINLPSKEELMVKLLQSLKSQVYKLHYSLSFPLKKFLLLMSAIKNVK